MIRADRLVRNPVNAVLGRLGGVSRNPTLATRQASSARNVAGRLGATVQNHVTTTPASGGSSTAGPRVRVPSADGAQAAFEGAMRAQREAREALLDRLNGPRRLDPNGCNCFVAGTEVLTPSGLVEIQSLDIGDIVIARHEVTGELAPQPITALIRPPSRRIWNLDVVDASGEVERFRTTDDHPWHNADTGAFEPTKDLTPGERLSTLDGVSVRVVSVAITSTHEPAYNLTVANAHTFFVGHDGIWVHNQDCGPNVDRIISTPTRELADDLAARLKDKTKSQDLIDNGMDFPGGGRLEFGSTDMTKDELHFAIDAAKSGAIVKIVGGPNSPGKDFEISKDGGKTFEIVRTGDDGIEGTRHEFEFQARKREAFYGGHRPQAGI